MQRYAGASLLAPALLNLTRLLDLDMSYNRVRNDGVVDLMNGVAQLTALRHLSLAGAPLTLPQAHPLLGARYQHAACMALP